MKPSADAIAALLESRHTDPFSLLGVHEGPAGLFARTWIPGAETAEAFDLAGVSLGTLTRIDEEGLFEGAIAGGRQPVRYRATGGGGEWSLADPYSFGPVLGPIDDVLMAEGTHLRLYDKMGAHPITHEGADGIHFAVWAPNARRVSLVGDFNDWDGRRHVMRHRGDTGVWEIFIPDIGEGRRYKFEIMGADGILQPLKADPFAFAAELRPATASVTTALPRHVWKDDAHRAHWASVDPRRVPISIYEVHAGSWDRDANGWFLSWDALADRLIPYVVDMGFTHIEFMPVSEYPYDPSWGYQATGLFAPTARFGDHEGFARFVEGAHEVGIGVLIDWVPAHFPTDAFGLTRFDGTALYEHEDPKLGFHPDWNTAIYNYGRREVASFLVNNALFWAEHYHVDGLRVDAVASMLYRDYSREEGEWVPNSDGGRENWEAVAFLRETNKQLYGRHPGLFTVAEESTAWPGVTAPAHDGGLGFGFKWNMGFMHDTLQYMRREPVHRRHHHDEMTFGLMYAFSENFVLPLSHDEVVHGKGSLLTKMAGDDWQQFANLRSLYALMWGYPGKKLLFMGQEFAQRAEWDEGRALDWHLREARAHEGMRTLVRDLNRLYAAKPALHARDCEPEGFEWLVSDDSAHSVFAWVRRAPGVAPIVVIANLTPVARAPYVIRMPENGRWREILNSDAQEYWGSGLGNMGVVEAAGDKALITLPPLATIMLEFEG
ncbi:1,4-alpha-glucan branching protein GlgB [Sphingomonas bacterium]|uniref:1,4-alpha-glucan branching protein GlgB n=1 Tax=Sphingomonas bacterium TaxID=1895847 RepID=UPI00157670BE|nr:1,4-alpha-glucan branching protein GlgB [Sphingomonas bacterium]